MHEVMEVEQALLMLGVEAFFTKVPAEPLMDDILRGQMEALVHLLHVVHRSHRASAYAFDWAVRLSDLHLRRSAHCRAVARSCRNSDVEFRTAEHVENSCYAATG